MLNKRFYNIEECNIIWHCQIRKHELKMKELKEEENRHKKSKKLAICCSKWKQQWLQWFNKLLKKERKKKNQ